METMEETKELLTQILLRLEAIERKVDRQVEEVSAYLKRAGPDLYANRLMMLKNESTRTLVELLRDEIEELHQIMMMIFREVNNKR